MKVVVLRIDNYTVNIDVVENGDSYFSSKTKYQVKKKARIHTFYPWKVFRMLSSLLTMQDI